MGKKKVYMQSKQTCITQKTKICFKIEVTVFEIVDKVGVSFTVLRKQKGWDLFDLTNIKEDLICPFGRLI